MQILGHRFPDATGASQPGLGLLDCETLRVDRPRAVGELLTTNASLVTASSVIDLGPLTGFENHAGRTIPGPSATTLASVEVGEGNGNGTEGIVTGSVIGTYLHGPALARNPLLADALLGLIIGKTALTPIDDSDVDQLRTERLHAAREHELAPRRSWRDLLKRS
jgi:CobQ-like glutamine amidotransferase family enzyme